MSENSLIFVDIIFQDQANSKTPFMLALETRDLKMIEEFMLIIPADQRRKMLQVRNPGLVLFNVMYDHRFGKRGLMLERKVSSHKIACRSHRLIRDDTFRTCIKPIFS